MKVDSTTDPTTDLSTVQSSTVLSRPAALLCDMDGTLVDTEPAWSRAVGDVVRAHGLSWTVKDDLDIVGWPIPRLVQTVQERGVDLPAEEIVSRLHETLAAVIADHVPWRDGAVELIATARRAGVPVALVTATYAAGTTALRRDLAQRMAERDFDAVVTGDTVRQQKPHPESYQRAAGLLKVRPEDCIAIEDSATGIGAAIAAGAHTFGVQPNTQLPTGLANHPRLRRVTALSEVAAQFGAAPPGPPWAPPRPDR
ncbi:HAD family hydrolase [Citricoccus sp. GCM10030269]|uniref:HAD family hydrolase n=1 Tax=Citricoccus sp. GCM10030269 TaxID=3273388 RepID=UPI00361C7C10